jgi:hypothetical protein
MRIVKARMRQRLRMQAAAIGGAEMSWRSPSVLLSLPEFRSVGKQRQALIS